MNLIRGISRRIEYPGHFFRFGTVQKRQKYQNLCRVVRFDTFKKRRALGQEVQALNDSLIVPEEQGFAVMPPSSLDGVSEAVEEARRLFAMTDLDEVKAASPKKYLLSLPIQDSITLDSPLVKLALHPAVLSAASRYIGMLPLLTQIQLWHSPNEEMIGGGSQFFHLDYADVRQTKVFAFVEDVTEDSGPFTVVPAHASAQICDTVKYKLSNEDIRVDDDIVYEVAGEENVHPVVGPSGTTALVDTCRCFHLGSRKASKPRTLIMIQYLSPFAFALPWDWKREAIFAHLVQLDMPEYLRYVLGSA